MWLYEGFDVEVSLFLGTFCGVRSTEFCENAAEEIMSSGISVVCTSTAFCENAAEEIMSSGTFCGVRSTAFCENAAEEIMSSGISAVYDSTEFCENAAEEIMSSGIAAVCARRSSARTGGEIARWQLWPAVARFVANIS